MRLGIVSDVHANLEALTVVLRELERAKVDRIVSLGDVVGYHANPNECVELLRRAGALMIAGNHDRAAAGVIEPTDFGAYARRGIRWTRRVLDPEQRSFLASLDVFAWLDETTCLVHAALHPSPNDRYHLSSTARIEASFAKQSSGEIPARLCFFGHTHRAVALRSDGHAFESLPLATRLHFDLGSGYYLVNPGSVGQPREQDRRASYAIFDDASHTYELRRAAYDSERCLRKAEAAGLLPAPEPRWRRLLARLAGAGFRP